MTSVFDRDQVLAWGPWLIWVFFFAVVSAFMPRDASFDVAHYHLHNGWSALNGRLQQDLAPAEMHSFLNPTFNVAVWWLIERLSGPAVSAVLGAVQALILPVLYYLARSAFRSCHMGNAERAALVCAIVGFVSVPVLATMASLRNDTLGALAFCCALLMLIREDGKPASLRSFALAAFLVGSAAGLKLTNLVYVPGLSVFVLFATPNMSMRLKAVMVCALGGFAGIALTGGWWMAHLYSEFGNPVFPLLNDYFHAPLGPVDVSRDIRYLPTTFLEAVLKPITGAFDLSQINEDDGRDLRLAAFYIGAATIAILSLLSTQRSTKVPRPICALALACLTFLFFWVWQFSIMRYATAAFLLGPIMLVLAWHLSPLKNLSAPTGKPVLYGLAVVMVFTTGPEAVRRVSWSSPSEPYLVVERPEEFAFNGAGIIMAGRFPTAFTSPAFSDADWIAHGDVQPWSRPFLENYRPKIRAQIASSTSSLFVVICAQKEPGNADDLSEPTENIVNTAEGTVARLGLDYPVTGDAANCRPLKTNFDTEQTHWVVCPLTRTDETTT